MKKIFTLTLLFFIVMICFSGCSNKKEAQNIVDKTIARFQNLEYFTSINAENTTECYQTIFKKFGYKIVGIQSINDSRVNVTLTVNCVDIKNVLEKIKLINNQKNEDALTNAVSQVIKNDKSVEEVVESLMKTSLKNDVTTFIEQVENLPSETKNISVIVIKQNNNWVLENGEAHLLEQMFNVDITNFNTLIFR